MLQLDDIQVAIDSVQILRGVSLRLGQGEMVGLIGNNGAGKTTTLRAVIGLARLGHGRVVLAVVGVESAFRPKAVSNAASSSARITPRLADRANGFKTQG